MIDLRHALLRLPVRFSPAALAAEVDALPVEAWEPHPTGFPGNDAVRLVSPGGCPTDALRGAMAPTEHLLRSPYIMELMGWLGGTWGRSRLMGLGPGAQVPRHVDCHYYWRTHLRIHIPVVTNPQVRFTCGGETVNMEPGECWVFDSFRPHEVHNDGTEKRVHLVLDTVGGGRLWDLIEAAQSDTPPEAVTIGPGIGQAPLTFERSNAPKVMSPWEMKVHLDYLKEQLSDPEAAAAVLRRMDRFIVEWSAAWAQHGEDDEGLPAYRALIGTIMRDVVALGGENVVLPNQTRLSFALQQLIFLNAIERPATNDLRAAGPEGVVRRAAM